MKILLEAIKAAGTPNDPDAIAKALEQIRIPNKFWPGDPVMSMGGVSVVGHKHLLQQVMAVNAIRDGQVVTLEFNVLNVP